jgi:hypothetical protein
MDRRFVAYSQFEMDSHLINRESTDAENAAALPPSDGSFRDQAVARKNPVRDDPNVRDNTLLLY